MIASRANLLDVLTRYEGALQYDNDDSSDETTADPAAARSALMDLLQQARVNLPDLPPPAAEAVPEADSNPEKDQQGPANSQP